MQQKATDLEPGLLGHRLRPDTMLYSPLQETPGPETGTLYLIQSLTQLTSCLSGSTTVKSLFTSTQEDKRLSIRGGFFLPLSPSVVMKHAMKEVY